MAVHYILNLTTVFEMVMVAFFHFCVIAESLKVLPWSQQNKNVLVRRIWNLDTCQGMNYSAVLHLHFHCLPVFCSSGYRMVLCRLVHNRNAYYTQWEYQIYHRKFVKCKCNFCVKWGSMLTLSEVPASDFLFVEWKIEYSKTCMLRSNVTVTECIYMQCLLSCYHYCTCLCTAQNTTI